MLSLAKLRGSLVVALVVCFCVSCGYWFRARYRSQLKMIVAIYVVSTSYRNLVADDVLVFVSGRCPSHFRSRCSASSPLAIVSWGRKSFGPRI